MTTRAVPSLRRVRDLFGELGDQKPVRVHGEEEPKCDSDEWIEASFHEGLKNRKTKRSDIQESGYEDDEYEDMMGGPDAEVSDATQETKGDDVSDLSAHIRAQHISVDSKDRTDFPSNSGQGDSNVEEQYEDIVARDLEEEGLEGGAVQDIPAKTYVARTEPESSVTATHASASSQDDHIVRTRSYDVSITYDNYYRTPRVYLYGYNENYQPLSPSEMLEDIMHDYAEKTVTIESHPHLPNGGPHVSIHPCRHAETMKRIVQMMLTEHGRDKVRVDQYLFLFLKFIQSVIPTIDYDHTMEVGS